MGVSEHVDESSVTSKSAPYDAEQGDGVIQWTVRARLATLFLCWLYVGKYSTVRQVCSCLNSSGSQIPLYFTGGSLSYMAPDLGGSGTISWLPVSNTLAIAAVAPFCGYLQDLFGRRNITLAGCMLINVGIIVLATGHSFAAGVSAMSLAGAGAAICELTALAGCVIVLLAGGKFG